MRCAFLWVPAAFGQSISVSFAFSEFALYLKTRAADAQLTDASKPLGCRSDVAVFNGRVSCTEAGNAGTISVFVGVSECRHGGSLARRRSRRRAVSALSYRPGRIKGYLGYGD